MQPYTSLVYNSDFQRTYRKGISVIHPYLVVYVRKNNTGKTRVGFTCSKKVGNAVKRNRARRIMKNGLLMAAPNGIGPYDIVLVGRVRTSSLKSTQLASTMVKIFEKENISIL
ncbi:MAG: ribonuclease P protein component [Oscillospiraceae bacterium]